jgi:hypothetical protein
MTDWATKIRKDDEAFRSWNTEVALGSVPKDVADKLRTFFRDEAADVIHRAAPMFDGLSPVMFVRLNPILGWPEVIKRYEGFFSYAHTQ